MPHGVIVSYTRDENHRHIAFPGCRHVDPPAVDFDELRRERLGCFVVGPRGRLGIMRAHVLLAVDLPDAEGPVEVEVVGFDRATRRREHEWPDQFLTVEASAFVLVILGSLQAAGEIERRLPRKAEYRSEE